MCFFAHRAVSARGDNPPRGGLCEKYRPGTVFVLDPPPRPRLIAGLEVGGVVGLRRVVVRWWRRDIIGMGRCFDGLMGGPLSVQ